MKRLRCCPWAYESRRTQSEETFLRSSANSGDSAGAPARRPRLLGGTVYGVSEEGRTDRFLQRRRLPAIHHPIKGGSLWGAGLFHRRWFGMTVRETTSFVDSIRVLAEAAGLKSGCPQTSRELPSPNAKHREEQSGNALLPLVSTTHARAHLRYTSIMERLEHANALMLIASIP